MKMQIWPAAMHGWSFNKLHCAEVFLSVDSEFLFSLWCVAKFYRLWLQFLIEVASVTAHVKKKGSNCVSHRSQR